MYPIVILLTLHPHRTFANSDRITIGNQFRSLEEDEVLFLDSVMEQKLEEERKRQDQDGEQVKNFKECI